MKQKHDYTPKSVFDFTYGNAESEQRIRDLASGDEVLPDSGVNGVVLYGAYGTGKTTLAKMLPDVIEQGLTGTTAGLPAEFIACQQGQNGPQVMTSIEKILSTCTSAFNASGNNYIVLDEIDNLTSLAQRSLKSAMNTQRGVFVMTTNNISQIDKGVLDRSIAIEMNAPQPEQLADIAQKIAADQSVVLNDSDIQKLVAGSNGSFRRLVKGVQRHIRRTKQAAVQPQVL